MYAVIHKTKKGGSGVMTTNNIDELKKKVQSLFKQMLEGTIYKDGAVIGRVWQDDSQRSGWNYSIDEHD